MKSPLDLTPYPRDPRSQPLSAATRDGLYVYVRDEFGTVFVVPDAPHMHPKVLGNQAWGYSILPDRWVAPNHPGVGSMGMIIAILENNEDRATVMIDCLRDKFRQYEGRVFATSAEIIRFLEASLDNTILVSLDHDLELKSDGAGSFVDGGTGREVADFLASRSAVCPVVIHTTNSHAAVGMDVVLREAGWTTHRVVPFDDTAWIGIDWLRTVRRAILQTARAGQAVPRV